MNSDFAGDEKIIPDAPSFSPEEIEDCARNNDYRPILFEWYKFVGEWAAILAHIMPESAAYQTVEPNEYAILTGLMNRCARLMLSNVALSHEGKFGEATAIIDRCIFESAVKIMWFCGDDSGEEMRRYLADSLRTEAEFKSHIEKNISERNGVSLPIEDRMLKSISRQFETAGLAESELKGIKKLRGMDAMIEGLGLGRLIYLVAQKIGSHHIHGTWSSLLVHYLEEREQEAEFPLRPSGHDQETHLNQFRFVPMIMLSAMVAFASRMLDAETSGRFCKIFESTEAKISEIYAKAIDR